jgi:hypothetical protein
MENESTAAFEALVAHHCDRLQPADALEFDFIEEMAAANWRMRRAWALERRIYENHAKAQPPGDEIDRMAAAFTDPATHPGLRLMHRYETRLHCIYQRALHNFLLLRAAIPNEPDSCGAGLQPAAGFQPAPPPDSVALPVPEFTPNLPEDPSSG